MASKLFDTKYQLIFYGQYHANKYNVAIHMLCVPLILWSSFIIGAAVLPVSPFFSACPTYDIFPPYFAFTWSWTTVTSIIYAMYYFLLDPVAALLYMPLLSAMFLSAGPLASTDWGVKMATWLFVCSWVAQFIGHGVAEKRAPALLDNILQAFVLAPFFVHLELLFALGYRPKFHKEISNGVNVEIAKHRKKQADAQRVKSK